MVAMQLLIKQYNVSNSNSKPDEWPNSCGDDCGIYDRLDDADNETAGQLAHQQDVMP